MENYAQDLHGPATTRVARLQQECQVACTESVKKSKHRVAEGMVKVQVRRWCESVCVYSTSVFVLAWVTHACDVKAQQFAMYNITRLL